jgi:hypothetical protein
VPWDPGGKVLKLTIEADDGRRSHRRGPGEKDEQ